MALFTLVLGTQDVKLGDLRILQRNAAAERGRDLRDLDAISRYVPFPVMVKSITISSRTEKKLRAR